MRLQQFVGSRSRWVIAFGDGFYKLFSWEWRPFFQSFVRKLFKNIDINMMILCKIECGVESVPEVIDF